MYEYPSQEELVEISNWIPVKGGSYAPLMQLVKSLWYAVDWGWNETLIIEDELNLKPSLFGEVVKYELSTAGWSGNEDLIEALKDNYIFWMENWYSSQRGGHHVFYVKKNKGE